MKNASTTRRAFGVKDFAIRWLMAFILIALTYNPTKFNFIRWAFNDTSNLPLKVLFGAVLLISFGILIRASLNSLGRTGIILATLFFAVVIWVMYHYGLLSSGSNSQIYWLVNIVLSLIFAIGLTWAGIWRRLTGQYSVTDVDGGDDYDQID